LNKTLPSSCEPLNVDLRPLVLFLLFFLLLFFFFRAAALALPPLSVPVDEEPVVVPVVLAVDIMDTPYNVAVKISMAYTL
jgi:hypothetical protein